MAVQLDNLKKLRRSLEETKSKLELLKRGIHYHINQSGASLLDESLDSIKLGIDLLRLFDNWDNRNAVEAELRSKCQQLVKSLSE